MQGNATLSRSERQAASDTAIQSAESSIALTLLRLTLGTLFVWVFVENLRKGLYTPSGYAGYINIYLERGRAPDALKAVMTFVANNAGVTRLMQATMELSVGVHLLLGLLTRPAALAAFGFLGTLWVAAWGTGWIWELLVPTVVALSLVIGGAGRTWGVDGLLRRRVFAPGRGTTVARLGRLIT